MNANGYRFLGYVLWKGGKWYLRRRLPPARSLALKGLLAGGAIAAVALLARRVAG
jgi:hypothetical protein